MFTGVEIAEAAVGHPGLGASAPCDSGEELTLSWQAGLEKALASESFCQYGSLVCLTPIELCFPVNVYTPGGLTVVPM